MLWPLFAMRITARLRVRMPAARTRGYRSAFRYRKIRALWGIYGDSVVAELFNGRRISARYCREYEVLTVSSISWTGNMPRNRVGIDRLQTVGGKALSAKCATGVVRTLYERLYCCRSGCAPIDGAL